MPGPRAVALAEFEALEDVQGHQGDQALAARRNLPDVIATVVQRDRFDPLRLVAGQVLRAQVAAAALGVADDGPGQLAAIEAFALAARQLVQGVGLARLAEHLAGARRPAVDEELVEPGPQLGPLRQRRAELVQAALPQAGDHRRDREAIAGQLDRRPQQLFERQFAEAPRQFGPGRRTARHGDRRPAVQRHPLVAGGAHPLAIEQARRAPAGVQAVQAAAGPDQGEGVAADPAAGRLDHRQRGGGGDRRVDGVAATAQYLQPDLRRLRLRGGDHAAAGMDRRTLRGVGKRVGGEVEHRRGLRET